MTFDPKTLKTIIINGKAFLVSPVIFDPLKRAEAFFYAATGKHILINNAYRSTAEQTALYKKMKAENPAAIVAPPGYSFHEKGQAIDIQNWQEAKPFLIAQGFKQCPDKMVKGKLITDKVHFSIGEFLNLPKEAGAAGILLIAGLVFLFVSTITKKGI